MGFKLATILTGRDLPDAELFAAKLDGEIFAVDEGFAAVDTVCTPAVRAESLREYADCGIIMGASAAWVYGAQLRPPAIHEVVTTRRLNGLSRRGRLQIHEGSVAPGDIVDEAGVRLTGPIRTAVDLARRPSVHLRTLELLLTLTKTNPDDCLQWLRRAARMPGSRRARERLHQLQPCDSPALTRYTS